MNSLHVDNMKMQQGQIAWIEFFLIILKCGEDNLAVCRTFTMATARRYSPLKMALGRG